ncbi:Heparinase II/III-like protein [Opitutaceae bacterium TAV1]|nr:Heparinase II/III-like protein [Opitutaceae bacterium TAV1]
MALKAGSRPIMTNRDALMNRTQKIFLAASFATLLAGIAIAQGNAGPNAGVNPEPFLFFDTTDVPALKERINRTDYRKLWESVLGEAREYCDPSSSRYANPEAYAARAETGDTNDASHYFGRSLTVWMQTLGLAWMITGDEIFARHGTALLEAGTSPPVTRAVLQENRFAGSRGDMMRALATGLDLFSGALTSERRAAIARVSRQYADALFSDYNAPGSQWRTTTVRHNFTGVCGGALGMLALALRHDCPGEAPAWIDLAEKMVIDWLDKGIDADGAGLEGVLYMNYGIGNPVLFADALWRSTRQRKAIIEHPHLKRVPYFLAMQMLPGELAFDARNDSLYTIDLGGRAGVGVPFLLSLATGFHGATTPEALAAWFWKKAKPQANAMMQIVLTPFGDPSSPSVARSAATSAAPVVASPDSVISAPVGQHFLDRGLCVWRTGWEKSDVMFSIEAGPYYPVTHNQADKGHFALYGLGYRWAVDTGYGNNREPGGRSQTVAHSCVLIDGKGQALSGAALGTSGKVLNYRNTATHGYALVDARSAYTANNARQPGIPVKKARRHAFFIRPTNGVPAYAVVMDDIQAVSPGDDGRNAFTWQMITWSDMDIAQSETKPDDASGTFVLTPPPLRRAVTADASAARPRMIVSLHASAPVTLAHEPFTPDKRPGIPPNDYRKLRAETRATNPRFVALLAPLPPACAAPAFSVDKTPDGERVTVIWPGRTDIILWQGANATLLDNRK